MNCVSVDEIRAAGRALPYVIRHTPVLPVARNAAEIGRERLHAKLENLQPTGAYKVRAAYTMIASLTPQQRRNGIVLTSSGNFAQAFALAARDHGTRAVVVMLAETSRVKIDATRELGARVDLFEGPALARQKRVEEIGRAEGLTVIDTWEERAIVVGHGTLGLEILADMHDVEQILLPVSSGGMAAGVAAAVRQSAPRVRLVGVQPTGANAAFLSLISGQPVTISDWHTIADGLSARRPGAFPFLHLQRYLDQIVLVEERDIAIAHVVLRRCAKIVAEPAGAVATAAFLAGRVDTALRTVAVVSGGNVADQTIRELERLAG